MDANTAYFLKKYYPHVIKWWLVVYNPVVVRIWPSKSEEEEALRLEAQKQPALEQHDDNPGDADKNHSDGAVDTSAYNATTGSYSGLYGQKPVDSDTQAALDAIMSISNNQNSVDMLLSGGSSKAVVLPPEQDEIIQEANAIYERLLREAAEDEAKKQAEIEAVRSAYEANAQTQSGNDT